MTTSSSMPQLTGSSCKTHSYLLGYVTETDSIALVRNLGIKLGLSVHIYQDYYNAEIKQGNLHPKDATGTNVKSAGRITGVMSNNTNAPLGGDFEAEFFWGPKKQFSTQFEQTLSSDGYLYIFDVRGRRAVSSSNGQDILATLHQAAKEAFPNIRQAEVLAP